MIALRILSALAALLFASATHSWAETNSPPANDLVPQHLELSWNTAPDFSSCSVNWDGKSLAFRQNIRIHGDKVSLDIIPSSEQWVRFWQRMDAIDVWSWHENYQNPNVRDGLVWHVKMRHGTKEVASLGRNAYPGASGPEMSKLFIEYQKAVEELIGRKLWQKNEK